MPIGDDLKPKWGRIGYFVVWIINLLSCDSKDWVMGNLRPGHMRFGSSGSQGKVQYEMMHVVSAQERMSVSTASSCWSEILL